VIGGLSNIYENTFTFMKIDIIYEDDDILVVNKPPGLLVHPDSNSKSTGEKTLVDWLIECCPSVENVGDSPTGKQNRPGIVHRLDKDTSGILIIAKNQKTFEYFKKLFQEHKIKKTYHALTYGRISPKNGIIKKNIFLKPGTTKRTIHGGKLEKEAITEYRVLRYLNNFSWVELIPKTGRTHQIRVHLSSIGHPIVGDQLYCPKNLRGTAENVDRQMLHAYSLEFTLSGGERIMLEADLPADIRKVLQTLGKANTLQKR
jgi:23S rRNA pseudouridine1911/1915/1917 synthase